MTIINIEEQERYRMSESMKIDMFNNRLNNFLDEINKIIDDRIKNINREIILLSDRIYKLERFNDKNLQRRHCNKCSGTGIYRYCSFVDIDPGKCNICNGSGYI